MSAATASRPSTRLLSLDAFRGLVVAGMIFVNNVSGASLALLRHATWDGLTIADAVFPSFVFIVGVSMAFSLARPGKLDRRFRLRFALRVAVLFALGVFINAVYAAAHRTYAFGVNGVLQRIALSSLLAAPFARKRPRVAVAAGLALLALHTALLLWVPVPGGHAGELTVPTQTLPAYVDMHLLGERGGLDPENLVGTISSAGGMLLGVAAGGVLLRRRERATRQLIVGGAVSLAAGLALSPWLPVNKRLWTATFVLVTAGIDTLLLAAFHFTADVRGHRRFFTWLEPLGRNALVLYAGSTLLDGLLIAIRLQGGTAYGLLGGAFHAVLGPALGTLAFAAANLAAWYAVAVVLHRRRFYVRL